MICILVSGIVSAQRNTSEIIDAGNIKSISIQSDEVYLIKITTSEKDQITISTHSEGEYYNDIALESSVKDDRLIINTSYPQKLTSGYDKLSAHKVFSLEIELQIPENLEITINSNIASLKGRGTFKSIFAELKQGYCELLDFSGAAVINTFSGYIFVETEYALIEAKSRNGKVEIPNSLPGRNPLKLTSIDGDIKVRKTK